MGFKKKQFKKYQISSSTSIDDMEKEIKEKKRQGEIDDDLLEIYSDDDGSLTDLSRIKVKKKTPLLVKILLLLVLFFALRFAFLYLYNSYFQPQEESFVLDVSINAPSDVVMGEHFDYDIVISNKSRYELENVALNIALPSSFVFLESSLESIDDNKSWNLDSISPNEDLNLEIRGYLLNEVNLNNMTSVEVSYMLSGFSSVFKREFFHSMSVSDLGFDLNLDYFSSALVGEEYKLSFNFDNFIDLRDIDMVLSLSHSNNIEVSLDDNDSYKNMEVSEISRGEYSLDFIKNDLENDTADNSYSFYFNYSALDREEDREQIFWNLKFVHEGKEYVFDRSSANFDVIKSDLHLNLLVNGSDQETVVNFGDTLEYELEYSNKGGQVMENVILMLNLDGPYLDWDTLDNPSQGQLGPSSISFSPEEIAALRSLSPGQSSSIKFSIKTLDFEDISISNDLSINNYAQYSMTSNEDFDISDLKSSDNISNSVDVYFNSDFQISERILYFDDNNIPVGSGPLPPQVDNKSSFRVYWDISNSLHELRDVSINYDLPDYIIWENNQEISAGNIEYDSDNHSVSWTLSRLPLGVDNVSVEFDIAFIPNQADYDKIIILNTGSTFTALDTKTDSIIQKNSGIRTSKLEDDSIAAISSDGRVR